MGTLATFFRRTDFIPAAAEPAVKGRPRQHAEAKVKIRAEAKVRKEALDLYKLRALPNDDVYFFCKRIDNSRLVRQADPETKGQCWSAIGAACVMAVMFGTVMAPKVAATLAGYKVQQLKQERQGLMEERKVLQVEEAHILSPTNLDALAAKSQLSSPGVGQIVHLQPRGDGSVASVIRPASLKTR